MEFFGIDIDSLIWGAKVGLIASFGFGFGLVVSEVLLGYNKENKE